MHNNIYDVQTLERTWRTLSSRLPPTAASHATAWIFLLFRSMSIDASHFLEELMKNTVKKSKGLLLAIDGHWVEHRDSCCFSLTKNLQLCYCYDFFCYLFLLLLSLLHMMRNNARGAGCCWYWSCGLPQLLLLSPVCQGVQLDWCKKTQKKNSPNRSLCFAKYWIEDTHDEMY